MTKLYRISDKKNTEQWWCFAPNATTAKKIVNKNTKSFIAEDYTEHHSKEDGVLFLIKANFVGIPQRSIFMLNGCMSSMNEHYSKKGRSGTLWWSPDVPGSRELWK